MLDLELFVAEGEGDFLKRARARRFKAAPGESFTETEPLPAPGTYLRAAARAIARGHRGSLGQPARLVVTAPLAAPADLTANASAEGVTLTWRGEVPAPLPTPTPPPLDDKAPPPATAGAAPFPEAPAETPAPAPVPAPPGEPAPLPPATQPPETATPGPMPEPTEKAPPKPKATPTPKPFVPGFFIFKRTPASTYGAPLSASAVTDTRFVDPAHPGESWCYVVRAVASADPLVESAPSNEACAEIKDVVAPAPPTGLTALAEEAGIEVRWSAAPDADVVAYRVYRRVDRGGPEPLAEVKAPATRFRDEAPPSGVRLRYQVSAKDGAGNESELTLPVDVTRP